MIETRTIDVPSPEGTQPIAVHTCGQGPLAVLIHGFPLDHRMWHGVMQGPLAQRRTLCAIDLRGHGQSPGEGDVFSMEQLADDVAAVIRQLGEGPLDEGPVDVCGLSMGGYVAFALHERHPECIRSLVLTNTRAMADTDEQRAGRDAGIATAREQGAEAVADAMLPKLLPEGASETLVARIREMIVQTPVATIVADQRGLQRRPDRRAALAGIGKPSLVIVGEHDAITSREEAEEMANGIPGATLAVIAGTGHMSPFEDPAQWSDAVAKLWQ